MRRTRAPSQISGSGQPSRGKYFTDGYFHRRMKRLLINYILRVLIGLVLFSGATRNTETLLNLLTSSEAENVPQPPEPEEPSKCSDPVKPGVK